MDVWVERTRENHARLVLAFRTFGMRLFDMTVDRFMDVEQQDVFGFGVPPNRIELLTAPKGLHFESAYPNRQRFTDGDLNW